MRPYTYTCYFYNSCVLYFNNLYNYFRPIMIGVCSLGETNVVGTVVLVQNRAKSVVIVNSKNKREFLSKNI